MSSFLFVKEILADLRRLTVRCECKKYSFHIHMLWCVRSSRGTLFSCVSHFHAFTGAHESPVFIVLFRHVLVIFCRLYGFPSWKLSWPLNESVKTRPVRILSVRKISLIVSVMCTRWNCLTREEYSLLFCIKILRLLIISKSRVTFRSPAFFPRYKTAT